MGKFSTCNTLNSLNSVALLLALSHVMWSLQHTHITYFLHNPTRRKERKLGSGQASWPGCPALACLSQDKPLSHNSTCHPEKAWTVVLNPPHMRTQEVSTAGCQNPSNWHALFPNPSRHTPHQCQLTIAHTHHTTGWGGSSRVCTSTHQLATPQTPLCCCQVQAQQM